MKKTLIASLMLVHLTSFADDLKIRSGPAQVALVELFTSEGCSSCPSADASLKQLATKEKVWSSFVPLAWHVDYWDHLGWRDRFSSADNTKRQRVYAAAWNSKNIYTPCFVLNGSEWRAGRDVPKAASAPGVLEAAAASGAMDIAFTPTARPQQQREAWAALLSGDVTSKATAGENRGSELSHSFVVLSLRHLPMSRDGSTWRASVQLPESNEAKAVAIWVTAGDHMVEQAAGGWLTKP